MPQPRVAVALALCSCLGVAFPAGARAITGAAGVAALNAQRAANGIPGDLIERREWTAACAAHNRYMALNGGLDHAEDPAKRGYTTRGAWASRNAVLGLDRWTADHSPWESNPIGLMQLLSPLLGTLGASASHGHVCATTWPGYLRPAPSRPSLYSYPGDGARDVAFQQWSFGMPFTPGDFVGLPAGFTTGPNVYVMADVAGEARITDASLVGPDGPVAIATVDNTVDRLGPYLPTGGMIIPVAPLESGATYRASVTLTVGGATLTRGWSFTTELADPYTLLFVASSLSFDPSTRPPTITQGSISVKTVSPAPVHVRVTSAGQTVAGRDLANGERWTPPQTPGTFAVCAHQDATDRYRGYDACRPLQIRDAASFRHPTTITLKAAIVGRTVRYKLIVSPARRREVTLSARRLVNGRWHTFRTVVRDANRVLTRSITARTSDAAVQLVVTVPQVRVGPELYASARLVKTIRRGG